MSKRPSFQFYPGDWQSNTNLKRCTFEEKGVWLELICLLHDSEEYGIIRWSLEEISLAIKCDTSILKSLIKKSILKGSDNPKEKVSFSTTISQKNTSPLTVLLIKDEYGPIWYSSRMLRDEYIRKKRAACGRLALLHPNVPEKTKEKVSISTKENYIEKDTSSPSPSSSSSSPSSKEQEREKWYQEKEEEKLSFSEAEKSFSLSEDFEFNDLDKAIASNNGLDLILVFEKFRSYQISKGKKSFLRSEWKIWLVREIEHQEKQRR